MVQNPPATVEGIREAVGSLGQEDPPGGGHGNLLQDSCLENPMDRGAWGGATVHGAAKESDMTERLNNNNRVCSAGLCQEFRCSLALQLSRH